MAAHYMCPVCRAPRQTELTDHIAWKTHLQIALCTAACMGFLYYQGGGGLAWRGLFLYLPAWAFAEFLHGARMREATKCRVCDFDPVLYKKDPLAARRLVEKKMNHYVADLRTKLQQRSPSYAPPVPSPETSAEKTVPVATAPETPTTSNKNES